MSGVAYEIVDVFTDRPFAGNSLAVVYDAADLAGDQMHTLAREFNLAETVFVLPPTAAGATYRVRIFTPEGEIPFAGHPCVGAAVTSMRRGLFPAGRVVQECGAGLLPITVTGFGLDRRHCVHAVGVRPRPSASVHCGRASSFAAAAPCRCRRLPPAHPVQPERPTHLVARRCVPWRRHPRGRRQVGPGRR